MPLYFNKTTCPRWFSRFASLRKFFDLDGVISLSFNLMKIEFAITKMLRDHVVVN